MEQHPVPQHISSYEFRLVGDMTLGQFFRIAAGAVISLIFYATPLPGIIKWPLVIFFAFFGLALAFLPLEERPLERWIWAFFRAIYSPTVFTWKKLEKPNFFAEENVATVLPKTNVIAPKGQEAIDVYIQSPPSRPEGNILSAFDKGESNFFQKMYSLFTPSSNVVTAPSASSSTVSPRPFIPSSTMGTAPAPSIPLAAIPKPQPIEVKIPQTFKPQIVVEKKPIEETTPKPVTNIQAVRVEAVPGTQSIQAPQTPRFSPEAAPPTPPSSPNVIVGQVLDHNGRVVEGAILEVKDAGGRPVRALRTNKVGHFLVVTPLLNGRYELLTEKEGLTFDPISFDAKGELISPISVRARGLASLTSTDNFSQGQVANQFQQ